ncbi:MAG: hypothetical protein A3G05_02170 [Candidatus Zambryskibacteria bacterium RIFCSPLOWO2_12_FULL_45_14]|uniref:Cupin 2 conserved barrel domain-containing protein n=2 Tax=Candidatus Zambryskiibacteriota TaxID=1817925 RepID=A0A1G2UNH6_9BACT|nr:MAG: hypothetical protein A3H60_02120 [Candidatus Zambryskibacteria bacterium RIFCSPLOWO2_02_FULL_44_12b]OHB13711.1 MAG: hypothetical protein A3G05_02170 [Candidatus Zambryskibacteria bacterium RIFCSPLOWO2_12_FULL_45_14]
MPKEGKMPKPRPVRHVLAETVDQFLHAPLKQGSRVVEESKRLYEDGFPVRFIQNYNVTYRLAEVHIHEDDIFLCMDGSVHFILGGQLVNPWTKDGLTFLADSINGGEEVVLNKGDWLHIPAGQAHQHLTPRLCHLMVVKVAPPEGQVRLDYLKGIKPKEGSVK